MEEAYGTGDAKSERKSVNLSVKTQVSENELVIESGRAERRRFARVCPQSLQVSLVIVPFPDGSSKGIHACSVMSTCFLWVMDIVLCLRLGYRPVYSKNYTR